MTQRSCLTKQCISIIKGFKWVFLVLILFCVASVALIACGYFLVIRYILFTCLVLLLFFLLQMSLTTPKQCPGAVLIPTDPTGNVPTTPIGNVPTRGWLVSSPLTSWQRSTPSTRPSSSRSWQPWASQALHWPGSPRTCPAASSVLTGTVSGPALFI
jgi:hypothetical protein